MSERPDFSVVLPIYNEEENAEPLLTELRDVLDAMPETWEILCVDDRSTDGSVAELERLAGEIPGVRVIRHTVNAGQSAALATGIAAARGRLVVTMDADLQHDPADLPTLYAALEDGVACVTGIRRKRHDSAVKRYASRIANGFRNLVTGDRIADAGCTFRVMRRDALAEVPRFNGMHRFLPTLLRAQGYTVVEVQINHRPRTMGVSKYGINDRLWRGIVDCLAIRWYRRRAFPGRRTGDR